MKHLSKLLAIILLAFAGTTVQAQDENNPWAIGIGINAVDFYPAQENVFSSFFDTDHWNILPSVSRISVGRYIGSGFSAELAGSINRIDKVGDYSVNDLTYYGLDATALYSLRDVIKEQGWFDPFVGIGGGYTWIDSEGYATLNGSAGINFWVSDNIALTMQTTYKHEFEDKLVGDAPDTGKHFQHTLGIKVAFGGTDTDGDGVYDDEDECPDTPGLPEFNGCPDSDGDGIPDKDDNCPNEAGAAEFNGCPDTDGDGIPDPEDECPEVAGEESLGGCPDTDNDGVKDSEDECPDQAGPQENNGCPWPDTDGDGVLDKDDQCPEVEGTVANNGCPEVTVEVIEELNEYSKTILFDLGKSTIREESNNALQNIVDIMKEYPNSKFHVEGHTDSTGSLETNNRLSKERAAAVKDYLIDHGMDESRLTSEGYGPERPIATNKTAAGRQQNRRVEISLQK